MKGLKIPVELKKALAERDTTLNSWCKKYGFNRTTTLLLLNGHFKNRYPAPKSKQILNAIKRDFPDFFETLKKDFPEIFKKEETIKWKG